MLHTTAARQWNQRCRRRFATQREQRAQDDTAPPRCREARHTHCRTRRALPQLPARRHTATASARREQRAQHDAARPARHGPRTAGPAGHCRSCRPAEPRPPTAGRSHTMVRVEKPELPNLTRSRPAPTRASWGVGRRAGDLVPETASRSLICKRKPIAAKEPS